MLIAVTLDLHFLVCNCLNCYHQQPAMSGGNVICRNGDCRRHFWWAGAISEGHFKKLSHVCIFNANAASGENRCCYLCDDKVMQIRACGWPYFLVPQGLQFEGWEAEQVDKSTQEGPPLATWAHGSPTQWISSSPSVAVHCGHIFFLPSNKDGWLVAWALNVAPAPTRQVHLAPSIFIRLQLQYLSHC